MEEVYKTHLHNSHEFIDLVYKKNLRHKL